MAIGVKYSAAKGNNYNLERKKNILTKTGSKYSNKTNKADISENNHAQDHISDKVEISKLTKAAHSYSSNKQAGTNPQTGSNLPSQPARNAQTTQTAQAAQNAQNHTLTQVQTFVEQLLAEQQAVSGNIDIQAIFEEIMAASENALKAFIQDLLSTKETSLQTLLDHFLGTSESTHILDFLTTIKAPGRNNNDDNNGSNVDDPTRRLTRRLVSATTTHEIHSILSEATKSLGDAIMAAASGDEEAQQIVRRLTRLIRRAQRKIGDLNGEDQVRRNEARARERELEELARQYELELRQRLAERKRRERRWLHTLDDDENNILPLPGTPSSGTFTAAQIKAMAWQAAKAAISSQAAAPSMPIGSIGGGSVGGGSIGAEASLSGGAASAEATPGGDAA